MKITPKHGAHTWSPSTLTVEETSKTTLSFNAFYDFFHEQWESLLGQKGDFEDLPRHIKNVARMAFGKKFKTYRVIATDPLPKTKIKGGGVIALYDTLERSDLKPGDMVLNLISGSNGVILSGEDGRLKEPCNKDQVIVRCITQKGKNAGKPRFSYWALEHIKIVN